MDSTEEEQQRQHLSNQSSFSGDKCESEREADEEMQRIFVNHQDYSNEEAESEVPNFIDEKEKVQKKVFMNWINSHVPGLIENDIITELRDGTKLITLIHALTGEQLLPKHLFLESNFLNKSNLFFLLARKLHLINIHASEIVDGNPRQILALIWMLILRFHIEEYIRLANLEGNVHGVSSRHESPLRPGFEPRSYADRGGVRQNLLNNLNRRFSLNINDFGPSWRDGYAFLTLIDAVQPQLKARERGRAVITNRPRLQLAFDLANEHLGIKPLLDPEDIDVDNPDERSIMTYVSQFLQIPKSEALQTEPQIAMPKIECDVIKKWVEYVMSSGITPLNIARIETEFDELKPSFDEVRNSLDPDTVSNWYLIAEQLPVGKRINDWNTFANEQLESYKIPTSADEVIEQLKRHYLNFSDIPKFENTSPLLSSLVEEYEKCLKLVKEWESAMTEASKRWATYNSSKDRLIEWIVAGEDLLQKSHDASHEDARKDYQDLKEYFNSDEVKNEAILFQFITACDEVLETLPEENQPMLRDSLKHLESRFHDIAKVRAPMHLIRFEFQLVESDLQKKLNEEDVIEEEVVKDLDKLEQLGKEMLDKFGDSSLLDKAKQYREQWENRKAVDIPKHEIALVRRNTLGMIYETMTKIESISIRTRVEIIKDNEQHIKNIKLQTQVLRRLSVDAGIDVSKDLEEIESHLSKMIGLLEEKKKEKVAHWVEKEAPLRLQSAKSETEIQSFKEEMMQYKQMTSETELVKKVDVIEAKTKLIEIERTKVDSIPEAEDKLEELKKLKTDDAEVSKRVEYLERKVLEEWKSIVDTKGVLQDWLKNKSFNADVEKIKAKEAEVSQLLERLHKSDQLLRTLASDLAVNELDQELQRIRANYKQEIDELVRYAENVRRKQEAKEILDRIEQWIHNNPIESIVPEYISSFEEALQIITKKQMEWQKLKDELQQIQPMVDGDLKRRHDELTFKLSAYDWNRLITYENHKFQALKESADELQRLRDQLKTMANLIDNLESKLSGISAYTDSLPKKKTQLEVSEELLKQIESIKLGDILKNETIEDEYRNVITRFHALHKKLIELVEDKKRAYNDHLKFSELCDKFAAWMKQLKDIVPPLPEDATNFDIFLTSLSNLLSQRSVGDYKIAEIKAHGAIAAEKSSEAGKRIINSTIEMLENDYNALFNEINKVYEESKRTDSTNAQVKANYQQMVQWLYDKKSEIKMLPLKKTLEKKRDQLKELEQLQSTLKEKESDIEKFKEFERHNRRISADIESIYNELLSALQFQVSRWRNYVNHHADFDASLTEAKEINNKIILKVKEIEKIDDVNEQCRFIDGLLDDEADENVFRRLDDQLKVVVSETSSEGADILTKITKQLQQQREFLKSQLQNLKKSITDQLSKKQKYDNLLERIRATLNTIEKEASKISYPSGSLYEKEVNASKATTLKNKCESIGIYEFPVIPEIRDEFEVLLKNYETIKAKLELLAQQCQTALDYHMAYNACKDNLNQWIEQMKKAIPALSAADQTNVLALRNSLQVHENLLKKREEGNERLETVKKVAANVNETSDASLTNVIKNEVAECEEKLRSLFADIENNIKFLKNAIDTFDEKNNLWSQLNEIEAWIKANPKDELLPDKCFNSISEALDEIELKKIEWQQQRDKLRNIYEALKSGSQDEQLIEKYNELSRLIEAYDWENLIRNFSEKLKQLIEFVEISDNLRNIVKQINALIDIIYYNYEVTEIVPHTDSLENKKMQLEVVEEAHRYICMLNLEDIPAEEVVEDEKESIRSKLEKFKEKLKKLAKDKQKAYADHFAFQKSCTQLIAWLRTLKTSIPLPPRDGSNVEAHLAVMSDLESQKPIGEKKLEETRRLCSLVLQTTSENGKNMIEMTMQSLEKAYKMIIDDMSANVEAAKKFKYETIEVRAKLYKRLSEWLLSLEQEIKELPLRSTLAEKEEQLSKLKLLEEELLAKEANIKRAVVNGRAEGSETTNAHLNDIEQRYQHLVATIGEHIRKWSEFVQNHKEFEQTLNSMQETSDKIEVKVAEINRIEDEEKRSKALKESNLYEECDSLLSKANELFERVKVGTNSNGVVAIEERFENAKSKLKTIESDLVASKDKVSAQTVVPEKYEFQWIDEGSDADNISTASTVSLSEKTDAAKSAARDENNDTLDRKSTKKRTSKLKNPLRLFQKS
ncbi:nesprin-1-like isoform X7 [Dinothrombium tinctorium]|uniref:Nesprin-1-like isoform X7 n=1 Tax=Dinothrombium tinctorium TaxID=1965070 RepID=A0A3S3NJZ4_9ACAR|nr:nesprin-1-like isoform X7 [Dinothrombium tinctorium]RWS15431.1 nesprin-1-like isoform X7 [Dinothrombium tinctorium]